MDVLPDELVISIISLLSAKERAKTSTLARRWRYFWKSTRTISFHDSDITICRRTYNYKTVVFVDRLLRSHSGETADELRIEFAGLNINNAEDIDGWIHFAFNKKVQKLHLNFNAADTNDDTTGTGGWNWNFFQFQTPNYTFPNVERFGIALSLVSLYLNQVDLRRDIVESLMCNCPNLEDLHIEMANGLNSFAASSTRLRRLAIIKCKDLREIEICAPNLVSYEIVVHEHECGTLDLTHLIDDSNSNSISISMPSLIHLSLGAYYTCRLLNHLDGLSRCFSRLETLNLQTKRTELEMDTLLELGIPSLPRLRELVVDMDREGAAGMILCFTHLKAAPLLRQIHLKFTVTTTAFPRPREQKLPVMGFGQKHECLKELRVDGYRRDVDREMIQYLMDNTVSLEKVVLNNLPYTGHHLHLLNTNLLHNS